MRASFASLEARVNGAVVGALANRHVACGAVAFDAIFDDAGALVLEGLVESTEPRLTAVPDAVLALLPNDPVLVITHPVTLVQQAYTLVRPEPDGTGFQTLYLRRA